jgi:hypothetical protein
MDKQRQPSTGGDDGIANALDVEQRAKIEEKKRLRCTLQVGDDAIDLPVWEQDGKIVLDLSLPPTSSSSMSSTSPQMYMDRLLVYDPFLQHTAPCRSAICYVDGDAGVLLYRGYRLEDLVERCSYLEVAYLLIYGTLPGPTTLSHWHRAVMTHAFTHVKLNDLMKSFNYDAHPMGMFISYSPASLIYMHMCVVSYFDK